MTSELASSASVFSPTYLDVSKACQQQERERERDGGGERGGGGGGERASERASERESKQRQRVDPHTPDVVVAVEKKPAENVDGKHTQTGISFDTCRAR